MQNIPQVRSHPLPGERQRFAPDGKMLNMEKSMSYDRNSGCTDLRSVSETGGAFYRQQYYRATPGSLPMYSRRAERFSLVKLKVEGRTMQKYHHFKWGNNFFCHTSRLSAVMDWCITSPRNDIYEG